MKPARSFAAIIILSLIAALTIISGAKAAYTYCYQETANASNAADGSCLLNYSGGYAQAISGSAVGWMNFSALIDGDYSTYTYINDTYYNSHVYLYANYSVPVNATNSSLWQVKSWGGGTTSTIANYSIPSACWGGSVLQLQLEDYDGSAEADDYGRCYNGTAWQQMFQLMYYSGYYEEGMYWAVPLATPYVDKVNLNPSIAYHNDTLQANATLIDPVGYSTIEAYWRLYNGSVVYASGNQSVANNTQVNFYNLSANTALKGETWTFDVTPSNLTDNWTSVNSTAVTILNSPPSTPSLTINSSIKTGQSLVASASSTDIDPGDTITYYYEFYNVNSSTTLQSYSTTSSYTIPSSSAHDEIRVRSLASDGTANSSVSTSYINVTNWVPVMNTANYTPSVVNSTSMLVGYCNASDGDNDALTYNYDWYNGSVVAYSGVSPSYTQNLSVNVGNATGLLRDENWTFSCQANDSYDLSSWLNSTTITVQNLVPVVTSVTMSPLPLSVGVDINVSFTCTDGDNNTCNSTYNATWYVNGVNVSDNSTTLGAGNFTTGDNVTVGISAFDGDNYSAQVNATTANVGDSVAPVIHSFTATPTIFANNVPVTLTTNCTDNSGYAVAVAQVTDPSSIAANYSMNEAGSIYTLQYLAPTAGTYFVKSYCTDGNGNTASSSSIALAVSQYIAPTTGGGGGGSTVYVSGDNVSGGPFTVSPTNINSFSLLTRSSGPDFFSVNLTANKIVDSCDVVSNTGGAPVGAVNCTVNSNIVTVVFALSSAKTLFTQTYQSTLSLKSTSDDVITVPVKLSTFNVSLVNPDGSFDVTRGLIDSVIASVVLVGVWGLFKPQSSSFRRYA